MRNLIDVINQILEISTNKELNEKLKHYKNNVGYTAPESEKANWEWVGVLLDSYIPNPLESEETLKIVSIFTTHSEDEIRKEYCNK
ncbi:hypothetical protein ACFVWC_16570 [Bacillus mycoides]|uniref:hypothetical protein n=1 Tax=Bacillus mycoides TaxID=1405 RepID=UPI0036E00E9A